jgi:hypothetical protein
MKRTSYAAAGGLLALGLASFLLPRDGVAFGPAEGLKLTKTFEGHLEFEIDEMRMLMNGEEQDSPMDENPAGTADYTIIVNDHFQAVADGRPTNLLRSFVEISGSSESSDGDSEEGSMEELEGSTVRFAWDDDAGHYAVTFEEGDGEKDALAFLSPDMDYRVLLPQGEVAVDDEWLVPSAEILRVMLPGSDLRAAAEAGAEVAGEAIPEAAIALMDQFISGITATCTYKGLSEVDGVEVSEIALVVEISSTVDVDPTAFSDDMDMGSGDMEVTVGLTMELEGTLLWNQKAGHFHSFLLEGDGALEMHMLMSIPDFDMEMETDVAASIVIEQVASAEAAE